MEIPEETIREYETQVETLLKALNLRELTLTPLTVREAAAADLRSEANSIRNIMGFGFGAKLIGGVPQEALAIGMYVVRKVSASDVHPDFLAERLVHTILGKNYLTDVIALGSPRLLHHAGQSYPLRMPGGVEISDSTGGAQGTLGGWVVDENDTPYLLSCWHCSDGVTNGGIGKDVLQPPGGSSIAKIEASIDPRNCPAGTVTIDATLAKIDDMARVGDFILRVGEIRGVKQINQTYVKARKFGVTTHLTTGGIVHLSSTLTRLWAPIVGQYINYEKQLLIQPDPTSGPFVSNGDSGSVVVDADNYAIGLVVGGTTTPPIMALATPIVDVLNALWGSRTGVLKFLGYP
jgi:hypothetical protein